MNDNVKCNNNYHFSLYILKGIRISDKTRVYIRGRRNYQCVH